MPRYPRSGVVCSQPVEYGHPLNRGRVAWWLTLPHLAGGPRWHDLMGLYPGTPTGMTSASGWRGTTRPGGCGHLLFNGTGDFVAVPTQPARLDTWTIAAWGYKTASGAMAILSQGKTGGGDAYNYYLRIGSNCGFTSGGVYSFLNTPEPTLGAWHHFAATYDGSALGYYLDGVPVASGFSGGSAATPDFVPAASTEIGRYAGYGIQGWSGSLDDVALWSRALSAAEVWSLYDESRAGYPTTLRRLTGRATVPMAPTGGGATGYSRGRSVNGGGVGGSAYSRGRVANV